MTFVYINLTQSYSLNVIYFCIDAQLSVVIHKSYYSDTLTIPITLTFANVYKLYIIFLSCYSYICPLISMLA